jgi:hypothetical protein
MSGWHVNTLRYISRSILDKEPESHSLLEDVIWALVIRRRPDGVGERLNFVPIPRQVGLWQCLN